MTDPKSQDSGVVLGACLAPMIGGAIIYYSLRSTHLRLANLGNRASWLAAVVWIAAWYAATHLTSALGVLAAVRIAGGIIGIVGIVLAAISVSRVKATLPPDDQQRPT